MVNYSQASVGKPQAFNLTNFLQVPRIIFFREMLRLFGGAHDAAMGSDRWLLAAEKPGRSPRTQLCWSHIGMRSKEAISGRRTDLSHQ